MKNIQIIIIVLSCFMQPVAAQDVSFTIANTQNTNDGTFDYYEADIMVSSVAGFKLGSGQLYFNYNTNAFGENIFDNGRVEFSHPSGGYILGYQIGAPPFQFNFYGSFISKDNTTSRVSFSWQSNYSDECLAANNVTATEEALFHIKIQYTNVAELPTVCFEDSPIFVDQTYTAVLNGGTCANTIDPGVKITDDNYNCSGTAVLPVELLLFRAYPSNKMARLEWSTATEINSDHFEIQHSVDGRVFKRIGTLEATGFSAVEQHYVFLHETPAEGINYYRLKPVDRDGSFEYSNIVSMTFSGLRDWKSLVQVYPNPASEFIQLELSELDDFTVELIDILGRTVFTEKEARTLDVSTLMPGSYYLKITGLTENKSFVTLVSVVR